MSRLLDEAFDPGSFRETGHKIVDMLADYLAAAREGSAFKTLPWKSPDDMLALWKEDFMGKPGNEPGSDWNLETFTKDVIDHSIHLHHPKNMGHQVVPPVPSAALVELVSALLNNSMAVYEVGPFSSAVERIVMEWLGKTLGMGEGSGGILTSGGSIGNFTGLLAARQDKAGYDIWELGSRDRPPLAVMVSCQSHYSVARAVKMMGWGAEGIVKIPVNDRLEIDAGALEQTYDDAVKQGKQVIALVANACSTSTGSYDPLEAIGEFCRSRGLWFHVDAAHGGGAVLAPKYKHLAKGIEHADSVVVDFHKMLLCPALTTGVVFKDGETAYETFSQNASYLLNPDLKGKWYDVAGRTLECTKKMMGIKVYALLKMYGTDLFRDYITRTYDLARDFGRMIAASQDFQAALEPASNIVCFRFAPPGIGEPQLNALNESIRETIKEDGEFYIVRTDINDAVYMRATLMNPFTSIKELDALLEKIRHTAYQLSTG